jgi:hypothetical protein
MKSFFAIGVALLGLSSSVVDAAAVHVERMEMARSEARDALEERQSPATCPSSGGNGPNSRHCWAPGFSKTTDHDEEYRRANSDSFLHGHVHFVAQYWRHCFLQSSYREHYL